MGSSTTVTLDFTASAELALEGLRNEIVHMINRLRHDTGLLVNEWVDCQFVPCDDPILYAIEVHKGYIQKECLLDNLVILPKQDQYIISINGVKRAIDSDKLHAKAIISNGKILFGSNAQQVYPTYWHALSYLEDRKREANIL